MKNFLNYLQWNMAKKNNQSVENQSTDANSRQHNSTNCLKLKIDNLKTFEALTENQKKYYILHDEMISVIHHDTQLDQLLNMYMVLMKKDGFDFHVIIDEKLLFGVLLIQKIVSL